MYVWRSKGRRDRRNFLSDGARLWGAAKGSKDTVVDDEVLRAEHENRHMQYFFDEVRPIMHQYLDTEGGLDEIGMLFEVIDKMPLYNFKYFFVIELVVAEYKRIEQEKLIKLGKNKIDENDEVLPPEAKKRNNVHAIFKRYDVDGSESLDTEELWAVLDDLNVPVKEEVCHSIKT